MQRPRTRSARPRVRSFAPLARADATLLVLGSMPGAASLAAGRYYAHPRNQFWPIMGRLFGFDPGADYECRVRALQAARIALWDVLQSCEREGSLDSRIVRATAVPNDFATLFARCPGIRQVAFNGALAEQAFRRHVLPAVAAPAFEMHRLPSTSPAHAGLSTTRKLAAWRKALQRA